MTGDEVRVAFALVPGEPHFSAVIKASQEIAAAFDNQNIIDADRFPPHVTVHICTVPADRMAMLLQRLERGAPDADLLADLEPSRLIQGSSGYVSVELVRSPGLRWLHEWVLEAAAEARGFRPARGGESDVERFGSRWILDRFSPHYSVAKVRIEALKAAHAIANRIVGSLPPARADRFEVCDIGPRSERWDRLLELPRPSRL